MSDKLTEALNAVVTELRFLSPIEFHKAIEEASKSEFAQTIDTINHFTSTIRYNKSDDGDTLSLFLPIENITPSTKQSHLPSIETIPPIENKPVIPKTETEDLPNTELYLKLPIEI